MGITTWFMEHKEIYMNRNNLFASSSQTFCRQLYSKNLPSSISDATQTELEQLPNDFLSSEIISKSSENQLWPSYCLQLHRTQGEHNIFYCPLRKPKL